MQNDKYISIVGMQYMEHIVPRLFDEAFKAYQNRDKITYQVSPIEYTHSSAGILLSVVAIESLRNKLLFHFGKNPPKSPRKDLVSFFDNPEEERTKLFLSQILH